MERYRFTFPGTQRAFEVSDDIFDIVINTLEMEIAERQRIKLVLSELYMNAYLYGCHGDSSKSIDVSIDIEEGRIVLVVRDQGKGLTQEKFTELINAGADFESDSGRGIRIVHKLSDEVRLYRDKEGKFCVESSKMLNKYPMIIEKNR